MGAGKFDVEAQSKSGPSNYVALTFWSAVDRLRSTVVSFNGDMEDRVFVMTVPMLKSQLKPVITENKVFVKALGKTVFGPRCFITAKVVCPDNRAIGRRLDAGALADKLVQDLATVRTTANLWSWSTTFFSISTSIRSSYESLPLKYVRKNS